MFEFLQQIGQKVAEFFAPQPFNPSRRGLMGIGAATAAQAAVTGGITSTATATATASGPNLNEHLEILKVIDELGRLKWDHGFRLEYPTPKLNDWITTGGEKDYVEKVKESATAYQAKYQAALQKLEELSSKGFSISMEEIRKPLVAANRWERKSLADQFRNLHFPKDAVLTPEFLRSHFPSDLLHDSVEIHASFAEKTVAWERNLSKLIQAAEKMGLSPEGKKSVIQQVIYKIQSANSGNPNIPAAEFTRIIESSVGESISSLPETFARISAEEARHIKWEAEYARTEKLTFNNYENKKKNILPNLSELFGGLEFRQRKDDTLIVYAAIDGRFGSNEFLQRATKAVQNILILSGAKDGLPNQETLFRAYLGNAEKERPLPLDIRVPVYNHLYIQLEPEHAMKLAKFYKTQKSFMERAKDTGIDFGDITSAVETLQSFSPGLARNSASR